MHIITIKFYLSGYQCVSPKWIGGWYSILLDINGDKTPLFFESIFNERGAFETSDLLYDILMRSKTGSKKITNDYRNAVFIRAWNSFVNNSPIKNLRYLISDSFPKIKGADALSITYSIDSEK
jgi:hypothetical protein